MKLSVLWSRLAGYSVSLFRHLAMQQGVSLQLVYAIPGGHLKFKSFDLSFCEDTVERTVIEIDPLRARLRAFQPDALLLPGWNFAPYLQLARESRRQGIAVISAMDVPWRGTVRQRVGCLVARWMLHPCIDALYVPGERQEVFGRRLGFREIYHGLYCAEVEHFRTDMPLAARPRNFLFVGRLIERKGVDVLLQAYARYRAEVRDPMGLKIVGSGPLAGPSRMTEGVEVRDFIQPEELPEFLREGQCLVLPSREENWGVVLHEAAAAGLPLIATRVCGATVNLLRDGSNGYVVEQGVVALHRALLAFHNLPPRQRTQFSENSLRLAMNLTPELQARQFRHQIDDLVGRRGRLTRPTEARS